MNHTIRISIADYINCDDKSFWMFAKEKGFPTKKPFWPEPDDAKIKYYTIWEDVKTLVIVLEWEKKDDD